jgi:deoxycytidylate deaminase
MHSGILKAAYSLASLSECYPFRCSAIIFKGKRIISTGINEIRSSKHIQQKYKRFPEAVHAEMAALMHAYPDDPKGASILVCRINPSGQMSNAKPCARCQNGLHDAGIKFVYCTNNVGTVDKYKIVPVLQKIQFNEQEQHDYRDIFIKREI